MAQNPNVGGTGGGLNEIKNQLNDVDFPVTKNQLVDQIGTRNVNINGKNMNLREVINKVPKDRFNSQDELLNEIKNVPEVQGGQKGGMGGQGGTQGGMGGTR